MAIEIPEHRRKGNGKSITIRGARGNNLKGVDVEFPLGKLIVVTGVSGSGKSTLINETLQPILSQHYYRSLKKPMPYDSIEGIENIDKVVNVDQSPVGSSHHILIMFYYDDGITQVAQFLQTVDESLVVSLVQTDTWLIEDVEHIDELAANLDVIKLADWLIDMGPEGGRGGGQLLFAGTPEEMAKSKIGYTYKFLAPLLKKK